MSGVLERGWDIEVLELHDVLGLSICDARDRVICRWLMLGDTRPFYAWTLEGHKASHHVCLLLAAMMAKIDSPGSLPLEVEAALPFGLKIAGRKRGAQVDPEAHTRDHLIAKSVRELREAGEKYEVAILNVHEWLPDVGIHVGIQTVRDAHDKQCPKASR